MIRGNAIARITDLVATAPEEALLLVGGPGSGKTTVLDGAAAGVRAATFRVRINPAESSLPLSGLSTIVASFANPTAVDLSRRLLRPAEWRGQIQAVTAELLDFIHKITTTPSLLLVDDADQMDNSSQVVLAMVAARLSGSGLRLVGTASSDPITGPLASLPRLTLAPLEFSEALELVTALTGPHIDAAVARIVVASSAGNPRAVAHIASLLTERQRLHAEALILPLRGPRISAFPNEIDSGPIATEMRLLLERLSSAYLSSESAVLQGSVRVPLALEELVAAGIVTREGRYLRIDNPLLRSQIYWSQSATNRLDHHASALRAEGGHEPELATWHRSWLNPGTVVPEDLLVAATVLTRQGRPVQALELAERALTLAPPTADLSQALADLSTALLNQGELDFADRYSRRGQRLSAHSAVAPQLAVLRTRIEFLSTRQLITAETDRWTSARTGEDSDAAAQVQLVVAHYNAERWESEAAGALLERAGRLLANSSSETVEEYNRVVMLQAALEGDPGPANRMYERLSRHDGAGRSSPQALSILGRSLSYLDRFAEARRIFTALLALEPAPDPIWLADARYFLAENDILSGHHHEAIETISRLHASRSTDQLHRNLHLLLMAWYWQAIGNRGEADAAIAECTRRFAASDNPALTARLLAHQGSFALMDGRLDDAIAYLRTASTIGVGFKNPSLLRHEVDLVEAYSAAGQLNEAVAQFQEFRARCLPYRSRWITLATARARALVTPGEPSLLAFQSALKLWHAGDSQFELGRTLVSYAARLSELGHTAESREHYLSARMILTQLGAISWARTADAARRGSESTPAHPLLHSLAPDEQVVAQLVCRGMRNKEIAAELFVSLRTVEVRLTRIYHKLGARSRSHLTAMLSSDGGEHRVSNLPN
jgi:DNA-binding CsgD family transcriptional regulator